MVAEVCSIYVMRAGEVLELFATEGLRSEAVHRTRLRVGKVIRSAVSAIRDHDPSLAHHLTTCIRTGYCCAYYPDPCQLISWHF